jgi:hypothetical protein
MVKERVSERRLTWLLGSDFEQAMNEVLLCTNPTVNPRSVMNTPPLKKEGPRTSRTSRSDADFRAGCASGCHDLRCAGIISSSFSSSTKKDPP